MSEAAQTTPDPAGLIPGYTLTRLPLSAVGVIEETLQRFAVERAVLSTTLLAPAQRTEVISKAIVDASYYFVHGSTAFKRRVAAADARMLSLMVSVRVTQPTADEDDLRKKIDALPLEQLTEAFRWIWNDDVDEDAVAAA